MASSGGRVGLLCSEPLQERMGGIGIRYSEIAAEIAAAGLEPVVVAPVEGPVPELAAGIRPIPFRRGRLERDLGGCDVVVGQGALADDLLRELPEVPAVVDLYDPWLVENLHYVEALGRRPYERDLASWILQLSRADLLLCASAEQRHYYLGFLTALGRVAPELLARDPTLESLLTVVPFGIPNEIPAHRPLLPARQRPGVRILFGAVYEWNDPGTAVEALEALDRDDVDLLFCEHPRGHSTPQASLRAVESRARERGWLGTRVRIIDWAPVERRFDLLRDVDGMVVTHRPGLETDLAFRARVVDALAAGCPVVVNAGGAVSRLLAEQGAGAVVEPEDVEALAAALDELATGGGPVPSRVEAGRALARRFRWRRCVEPLVRFCREPRKAPVDGLGDVASILRKRRGLQRARYLWARTIQRFGEPW